MIIDSSLQEAAAKSQNPRFPCPDHILARLDVITLRYWSLDCRLHQGQLVIDRRLTSEIIRIFQVIEEHQFPIARMVPAADPRYQWNDTLLMAANVTSCHNFRLIVGRDKISNHGYGQAIDINPLFNPCIKWNGEVSPPGAAWERSRPGTLTPDSIVVRVFEELGWTWGGRWRDPVDYQHFEKVLSPASK